MFYIFAESLLNSGNITLVFNIPFVYWEGFFSGGEMTCTEIKEN